MTRGKRIGASLLVGWVLWLLFNRLMPWTAGLVMLVVAAGAVYLLTEPRRPAAAEVEADVDEDLAEDQ